MKILSEFNNSLLPWRIGLRLVVGNDLIAKQNGRNVWLNVHYLVIWYPDKNLLHLYKSCLLKVYDQVSLNLRVEMVQ